MSFARARKTVLIGLALIAFSAVGYAHSQSSRSASSDGGVRLYRSHWFLGGCALRVVQEGPVFTYMPVTESRAGFTGPWPTEAGDLYLSFTRSDDGVSLVSGSAIESRPAEPDETLIVHFEDVDGHMRPTRYLYKNLRSMRRSNLIQPYTCTGLGEVPAE